MVTYVTLGRTARVILTLDGFAVEQRNVLGCWDRLLGYHERQSLACYLAGSL